MEQPAKPCGGSRIGQQFQEKAGPGYINRPLAGQDCNEWGRHKPDVCNGRLIEREI